SIELDRSLRLPCPSARVADTVARVLSVDRDVRPSFARRRLRVDPDDERVLIVDIAALTLKDARTTATSFFEVAALVVETMDAFPALES
ncbi:hypothetical protein HK405_002112, partial [Cladochytrium tenue]